MLRSMTGYSRSSAKIKGTTWTVEIHSVNRKNLDIHLYLPKEFLCFDVDIRKQIGDAIKRGLITIRVTLDMDPLHYLNASNHLTHLKAFKQKWQEIALDLGFNKEVVSFPFLVEQLEEFPSLESGKENQEIYAELEKLVDEVLKKLIQMKQTEGAHLSKDIQNRLVQMENDLKIIEKNAERAPEKFREKLRQRITEIAQGNVPDEERLLREVAFYAEKVDITEELVRLKSHLAQMRKYLHTQEQSIGRSLDFLTQEMSREIHTISAKSSDLEISQIALAIKSELEKIREQVQNIE